QSPPPTSPLEGSFNSNFVKSPQTKTLLQEIPEKYTQILALYAKVPNNTTPPILYVEACLKVAKFLATCYLCGNGLLDENAMAAIIRGDMKITDITNENEKFSLSLFPTSTRERSQSFVN